MALQRSQRIRYPLVVVALVLGIFVLRGALTVLVDTGVESGFPAWLPTFGNVGQTVMVYLYVVNGYAYLLVPAVAFWLGLRYERVGE